MQSSGTYDLAGQVIGCAMRVHASLRAGFLESVYQNALCLELTASSLPFETEKSLTVTYRDEAVGSFYADIIVQETLIVELKAIQAIASAHEVQLVNYLTATGIDEGLLLNFGASSLQFKKKFRTAQNPQNSSTLQS